MIISEKELGFSRCIDLSSNVQAFFTRDHYRSALRAWIARAHWGVNLYPPHSQLIYCVRVRVSFRFGFFFSLFTGMKSSGYNVAFPYSPLIMTECLVTSSFYWLIFLPLLIFDYLPFVCLLSSDCIFDRSIITRLPLIIIRLPVPRITIQQIMVSCTNSLRIVISWRLHCLP